MWKAEGDYTIEKPARMGSNQPQSQPLIQGETHKIENCLTIMHILPKEATHACTKESIIIMMDLYNWHPLVKKNHTQYIHVHVHMHSSRALVLYVLYIHVNIFHTVICENFIVKIFSFCGKRRKFFT